MEESIAVTQCLVGLIKSSVMIINQKYAIKMFNVN